MSFTTFPTKAWHPSTSPQAIAGASGSAQVLTSFAAAAAPADWPLVWAAVPVVDEAALPPPHTWSALRLRSPPVLSTVLAHVRAVSTAFHCFPVEMMRPVQLVTAGI